jgi:hypothetical protein
MQLPWFPHWLFDNTLVDAVLSGDTNVCAMIGVTIGAFIAARRVKKARFGEFE